MEYLAAELCELVRLTRWQATTCTDQWKLSFFCDYFCYSVLWVHATSLVYIFGAQKCRSRVGMGLAMWRSVWIILRVQHFMVCLAKFYALIGVQSIPSPNIYNPYLATTGGKLLSRQQQTPHHRARYQSGQPHSYHRSTNISFHLPRSLTRSLDHSIDHFPHFILYSLRTHSSLYWHWYWHRMFYWSIPSWKLSHSILATHCYNHPHHTR